MIPRIFRPFLLLFSAGALVSIIIALWFPEYSKYYVKDNRVVENIGAQLFLWSGIVSLWAAWIWRTRKYVPMLFALVAFVCALDEISWGRGELKFEPFKVMGVKIDAAHDFMDVFRNLFIEYGEQAGFIALLFVGFAFLAALGYRFRHVAAPFLVPPRGIFAAMLAVFFLLSSSGDLFNLDFSERGKMYFAMFEEYLETAGALAFLFLAWSLVREGKKSASLAFENKGNTQPKE